MRTKHERLPSWDGHYQRNDESGGQLRRAGSLRLPRSSDEPEERRRDDGEAPRDKTLRQGRPLSLGKHDTEDKNLLKVPRSDKRSTPATVAHAPEYLARSLLQLGCPAVSMLEPRGGVGSEHHQGSSDSDDSTSSHHVQQHNQLNAQGQAQGQGPTQSQQPAISGYGLPKVQVSGPANASDASIHNGSAGSIGARSAPSTPLQGVVGTLQQQQNQQQQQPQQVGGSQLTVTSAASGHPPPPKSPSHAALRCKDGQLSKPLSRSTPSMTAGGATITTTSTASRSSTRRSSPHSTSSGRQKKFHRHFSQVTADERVLNYYSCALVGDILLQGHLYITPNYFAFYSNVFGYVTKLLIPTATVLKISKEKTARIIPNAVAVATIDERHVFCSLLSRDSTFKLMKQVWDAALEARDPVADSLPLPVEAKLLVPDVSLVDDSEVNAEEEDDSSMSESGTDLTSRPPTVCTDTDAPANTGVTRLSLASSRLDQMTMPSAATTSTGATKTLFPSEGRRRIGGPMKWLTRCEPRPATVITILVALLAALYLSAALMMLRIDRLHTAYLNHPLASPERFTQDRLMQYLTSNLDQIVKVRQSLQTLSQQLVAINREDATGSGGITEPEEPPS